MVCANDSVQPSGDNTEKDNSEDIPERIELIEITGSRLVQDNFLLGRTIVDRSTLERRQPSDLTEALSFEAGLYINQPGGGGSIATLHLRGAEPNYTLVLIDGVAITDTTDSRGGSFDLAGIDPSTIEKIEIIQGAALPLYGPGALSGVVNIQTRRPQGGETSFRIQSESDFDGFLRLNGGTAVALGDRASLTANIAYSDTGRLASLARAEALQAISKLHIKVTDAVDTQLFFRISDTEEEAFPDDSGGVDFAVFRTLDQRDTEQRQIALLTNIDAGGAFSARTSVSWFHQTRAEVSPGIAPGTFIPPNGADTELERFRWRGDVSAHISKRFSVLVGGAYEHEEGRSDGFLFAPGVFDIPFSLTRETVAGFAETRLQLWEQTLLHGAVRVDDVSGFGTRASVSLGLVQPVGEQFRLRLGGATGFRPPSFFALSHPLTGNPDLEVEKARTSEVSLEYQSKDQSLSIAGSVFYNRFRNQVDFDEVLFTHVNRERLTVAGAELRTRWQPSPDWTISANITYLDLDIAGLDRPPRNRPDVLFGASASYRAFRDLTLTVNGQVRGQQFASSFVTGPVFLDAYGRLDAVALWTFGDVAALSFKLLNILDSRIEEAVGFPAPGRQLRLGLSVGL